MAKNKERRSHKGDRDFADFSAFDLHSGKEGGNKVDQQACLNQMQELAGLVADGTVRIVAVESTAKVSDDNKRRARIVIESELA